MELPTIRIITLIMGQSVVRGGFLLFQSTRHPMLAGTPNGCVECYIIMTLCIFVIVQKSPNLTISGNFWLIYMLITPLATT